MAEAALFALVLLVGVGGTLLLFLLIDGETSGSETMERADAEAYARRRSAERYADDAPAEDTRDDRA
ncbi:hypothetical protein [Salinigranum marinum]|uniref:hypothetical protein n=1 Tax=Salinigranum marinum TaxID=1515595 RepID=UPI002989BC9C|nr:hypothetical protein [Salinigranum marinum]